MVFMKKFVLERLWTLLVMYGLTELRHSERLVTVTGSVFHVLRKVRTSRVTPPARDLGSAKFETKCTDVGQVNHVS